MRRRTFSPLLALILVAPLGCGSGWKLPAPEPQWSREEFQPRRSMCISRNCRSSLAAPRGRLILAARTKTYGRHEIPGWDKGSATARVLGGILKEILRRKGWTTESVEIGLGSRTVSDSSGGWQLRCAVFWLDKHEEGHTEDDFDDVSSTTREAEGADCRAVTLADTGSVRWRFRAGIAPPRDSLATLYDSLVAAQSPLISRNPPMSLERVTADGTIEARYDVSKDGLTFTERMSTGGRIRVTRDGGDTMALIYTGSRTRLDLAPGLTEEETRVLRLLAGIMTVSFRTV